MSVTRGTTGTGSSGAEQPDTYQRSLAHWAEQGRAGMESFYALASEDYRQMVAARPWSVDLRRVARDGRVRALDVACGSGKFPAELMRRGLADALAGTTVEVDLLDPSDAPMFVNWWRAPPRVGWRPGCVDRAGGPGPA